MKLDKNKAVIIVTLKKRGASTNICSIGWKKSRPESGWTQIQVEISIVSVVASYDGLKSMTHRKKDINVEES